MLPFAWEQNGHWGPNAGRFNFALSELIQIICFMLIKYKGSLVLTNTQSRTEPGGDGRLSITPNLVSLTESLERVCGSPNATGARSWHGGVPPKNFAKSTVNGSTPLGPRELWREQWCKFEEAD